MNRVRNYTIPHKALRNGLARFTHLAGTTDYMDPQALEKLKALGADVFFLLDNHLHTEQWILDQLDERAPGASHENEEEHERIEALQHELQRAMEALYPGVSADTAYEFYLQASCFNGHYMLHMNHEETASDALLWAHFTDAELTEIHHEILVRLGPEVMGKWFTYAFPAFSTAERIGLLAGMKATAPRPAFEGMLGLASTLICAEEFELLLEPLGEAEMA